MTIPMPTNYGRPAAENIWDELKAPLDWMTLFSHVRDLYKAKRGNGRPVMLVPGYTGGHLSMTPLEIYLKSKGYDTYHWGLGKNEGEVEAYTEEICGRAKALAFALGQPITLIGYSLGGVVAREVARRDAANVCEVITIGTPIIGGIKGLYCCDRVARDFEIDPDEFEREVHARNAQGLRQKVTAIYSMRDNVVSGKAAMDPYNVHARNIRIDARHYGLLVDGRVFSAIAETLAMTNWAGKKTAVGNTKPQPAVSPVFATV